MNILAKEFEPLKLGDTKKVYLKNGSSISVKWKNSNEFIIRFNPENITEYYSPFFLFKFENAIIKKVIPYPDFRSFLIKLTVLIGIVYFKKTSLNLSLIILGALILFTLCVQTFIGIASYYKIKKYVFNKNKN